MFEEIAGIPAHPLLVHAAVVFVPLLALAAVAYAFLPFVRPHLRWVLALLAVAAPVAALLAKLSGDAFLERLGRAGRLSDESVPRLAQHQDLGTWTLYAAIALGLLTLALVVRVKPADGRTVTALALGALTLVAAGAGLYFVVRTGDTGAQAVWNGQ